MHLGRTLPLVLLLTAGAALGAVEEWEADNHFLVITQLVDRNLRLPAQRQIAAFEKAAYPKGSLWAKGLRFYYAKRFQNLSPDPAEREKCAADVKALEEELKAQKDKLPTALKNLLENDTGPIEDLTNLVLGRMNPDAPPPKLKLKEADALELTTLIQELIKSADKELDAAMEEVKAEDFEFDDTTDEGMANIKKATFRRYKFANVLYSTYKVMREVSIRADAYGLDPVKSREIFERWVHTRLQKAADKLGDWEWIYAPYYPFLKHRLNVLRAEIVRLNKTRPELADIKANDTSYSEVKDALLESTSLDTKIYKAKEVKNAIELLKLAAWADLLQWHMMLGDAKSMDAGIEMFENDFLNRGYKMVYADNPAMEAAVGHVYIVAQQLYNARGNNARRDELLSRLSASKNFFAPNASLWIQYYIGDPKGGSYEKPPVAVVAKLGMNMATRLWIRGRDEVDKEKGRKVKLEAIVNMRNALKGLPTAGSQEFFDIAPELYQSYAYYLFSLGWYHQAVLVARDGLTRFAKYWKGPKENAWIDRTGAMSKAGVTVTKLAGNLLSYAITLRNRAPGVATDGYFNEAVDLLKRFDPVAAEDLGKYQIIIYLNNGEYDQALCLAEEYLENNRDKRAWTLGIIALTRYKRFSDTLETAGRDSSLTKDALAKAREDIQKAWDHIAPVAQGQKKAPKGQEKEYQKQYRNLIGIKVAIVFQEGDYTSVLKDLDENFWKEPPDDVEMNQKLLLYMANAIYKIVKDDKAANKLMDPKRFLENWKHYAFVKEVFDARLAAMPELGSDTVPHRKAMGQVFTVARKQANMFASWQTSKDPAMQQKVEGIKPGTFAEIEELAMSHYAEAMEAIIDESSDPLVVISVADSLWNLGKKPRAAELYEIYKETLDNNPEIKRFKRNPRNYLADAEKTFSVRTELKPFFQGRGSIQDLLLDSEDFLWRVYGAGRPQDEWKEEKADYGKAYKKVVELDEAYQRIRRRVPDKEGMDKAIQSLKDLVHGLVSTLKVNTRLIEVYRDQGGEKMNVAIALAKELYAYNPRSILFRSFIVQSTIQALAEPPFPDDKTVRESRRVALEVRKDCAANPRYLKEYWIAVCQILEMSAYLKDMEAVTKTLQNNLSQSKSPIYDLCVPGSDPIEARDKADVEICNRYLKLFDLHGVDFSRPYRIEVGSDSRTYFLEGNEKVEDAVKARAEAIKKALEAKAKAEAAAAEAEKKAAGEKAAGDAGEGAGGPEETGDEKPADAPAEEKED